MQTVSVFAPISIGNVSVGFDSLGLAMQPLDEQLIGDVVEVSEATAESQLVVTGSHGHLLPPQANKNIVWDCLQAFNVQLQAHGRSPVPVTMTLHKNIPVSSGLGSSACSVVAAFNALNYFYGKPFDNQQLLTMMAEQEGKISGSIHYDNIAPSFLGGMQLMTPEPSSPCISIPVFDDCYWVLAYPDIEVSTKAARDILPDNYSRQTTISFGQHLAGFVAASFQQNKLLAMGLLKDVIAEPHRQSLLPDFQRCREQLLEMGMLGTGISGSGPTMFTVTDNLQLAEQARDYLDKEYLKSADGFVSICKVDIQGSRPI